MRRMYSKPQLLEAVEQESKLNGIKLFENIVDKDGHPRFIEGTLSPDNIANIVWGYNKWSLSGSHLLIVLCGTLPTGNLVADNTRMAVVNLPDWLKDKLIPIVGTTISLEQALFFSAEYTVTGRNINLRKTSVNDIEIRNMTGNISYSEDRTFRIEFDLLIDNE